MTEADKLFEELGYKINEINTEKFSNGIQYLQIEKDTYKYIEFYNFHKEIAILTKYNNHITKINIGELSVINLSELKAIVMKVKELGWEE